MTLTSEELVTLSQLLDEALELPESARNGWLSGLSVSSHLQSVLQYLLTRQSIIETHDYLNTLPKFTVTRAKHSDKTDSNLAAGLNIGPYQLVRELGHGGMGEVWLATRSDGIFSRQVALKLPHAHLLTGALRQRFDREREILATLSHPHIATLYDAGISDSGHPYLAMEWVDGIPITQYCNEACLSIDARLELLKQVLDAVQYAHSRFIAHRDLKPSNILVTKNNQIKLLDFGVAKLLNRDSTAAETELTRVGGRAVTPGYAAPEQLADGSITTAVDIYSLGIVLFELLTGNRPFGKSPADNSRNHNLPLASRSIDNAYAKTIDGATTRQLCSALQGDLDAILIKAMEFEPALRYRSAETFADDIECFRRHEPILARHISTFTLLRKFVRRHRLTTALTTTLFIALMAGAAGILWQSTQARRAAQLAEHEAHRAESEANREKAVKDFLINVFSASDPRIASDKPRGTITAKELLDISSDKIEKQFSNDPQTKVELLNLVADIYLQFGETARSEEFLQHQIELARTTYGESHPVVIRGLLRQAMNANFKSDYSRSLQLLAQIDALIHRGGLDHSAERALWWFAKSGALVANPAAEAEMDEALQKAVDLFAQIAPDDRNYPPALSDLADVYFGKSDYARAVEYNRRAIAAMEKQPSGDEGDLAQLYGNLGITLTYAGNFDAAQQAYLRAVQLVRATFGENSRSYWVPAARYAQSLHLSGDYRRAEKLFRQLIPTLPSANAKIDLMDQHELAIVHETYGTCLAAEGHLPLAIHELEIAGQQYAAAQSYYYELIHLRGVLGTVYDKAGRTLAARNMLKWVLDQSVSSYKAEHPATLRQREAWGAFLLKHGDSAEAEEQFREVLRTAPASKAYFTALAYSGLAQAALVRKDNVAAVEASRHAVDLFDHVEGFHDVRMGPYIWRIHAEVLLRTGNAKDAEKWAQRALDADRQYDDPDSKDIVDAQMTLNKIKATLADNQTDSAAART